MSRNRILFGCTWFGLRYFLLHDDLARHFCLAKQPAQNLLRALFRMEKIAVATGEYKFRALLV